MLKLNYKLISKVFYGLLICNSCNATNNGFYIKYSYENHELQTKFQNDKGISVQKNVSPEILFDFLNKNLNQTNNNPGTYIINAGCIHVTKIGIFENNFLKEGKLTEKRSGIDFTYEGVFENKDTFSPIDMVLLQKLETGKKEYKDHLASYEIYFKDGEATKAEVESLEGSRYVGQVFHSQDYENNTVKTIRYGKGELTVFMKNSKVPLYTEIYDDNGYPEKVRYYYFNPDYNGGYKMDVYYNRINRALNFDEINSLEALVTNGYVEFHDNNDNINPNSREFNFGNIREVAIFQMQSKFGGSDRQFNRDEPKNKASMALTNLITISSVKNLETFKLIRYQADNNGDLIEFLREKTYKNAESLLNSFGLTSENQDGNGLKSIHSLNSKYISSSITAISPKPQNIMSKDYTFTHTVGTTLILDKITKNPQKFILTFDSSRNISFGESSLGELTNNCEFYCHFQQKDDTCWLHAPCAVIVMAENPEMIFQINRSIQYTEVVGVAGVVTKGKKNVSITTLYKPQIAQLLKIQEIAQNLGVPRFGSKKTKKNNRPRMLHQVVNDQYRNKLKQYSFTTHKIANRDRSKNQIGTTRIILELANKLRIPHAENEFILGISSNIETNTTTEDNED